MSGPVEQRLEKQYICVLLRGIAGQGGGIAIMSVWGI